ncbi:MAG: nucleotide sugar dehydrogenase [Chloroflexota bacterium]
MDNLEQKLADKTAVIGVAGLGYVGLPLSIAFAEAGLKVLGFDMEPTRVDAVNEGRSYIADVSDERLAAVTGNKRLQAITSQERLTEVDAVCICVPTPLTKTKEPDLSYIVKECEELSRHLRAGQLVVMESTTYPGTTREVILPILERSGLKTGTDFFLAYSPERIDPGNKNYTVKNTPKPVSGIDAVSTRYAELLYRQVADTVIPLSSPETAELTKIFENVFRIVNIALVNELTTLCRKMGIDVWEVIDAASTKPFGYMRFQPGPGVGGHCIPLDPYYLASKAKEYDFHTRFIELAAEINESMPYNITGWITEALNNRGVSLKNAGVLVLGVAYKKDVGDTRESPSLKLIRLLRERGAAVSYNDPYVPEITIAGEKLKSVKLDGQALSAAECVVIATDHSDYNYDEIVSKSRLVFDTRGVTRKLKAGNIIRL